MSTQEKPLYVCPNGCEDSWFFQDGNKSVRQQLSEEGDHIEDDDGDFVPTGPVKCYKCQAEAIQKIKKTTVTEEIIDLE